MKPSEIAKIAQIASALEVSGYPKPGNVHRTRDYDDMVFEDFVISGIVIGDNERGVPLGNEALRNLGGGDVSARADLTGMSVKLCFELHYFTSMMESSHISGAL